MMGTTFVTLQTKRLLGSFDHKHRESPWQAIPTPRMNNKREIPMSKAPVKIGCAAAFWGDTNSAAAQLVHNADIDYLVFDYLAEVTLSIMAGARLKNPDHGYAHDFVTQVMKPLAKDIHAKGIKVISNAGGVNPRACRKALEAVFEELELPLKVALVEGDDVLPLRSQLGHIEDLDTQAPAPPFMLTMNAYLGAGPIQAALDAGADIVLTGRIVDSALVLGPLMYHFGWSAEDYHKLAQGSLAGHLIECGAQSTGGNFTDWHLVKDFHNMGFPIVECYDNGDFILTKPEGTGGLVSRGTVGEQLLYEIGDPRAYLLPDVTCDFTQVTLEEVGTNRVKVTGARGLPPTNHYKVSATYPDGYRLTATFLLGGMQAVQKAQAVATAILTKVNAQLNTMGLGELAETHVELLGTEATYGPHGRCEHSREVVVKIAARHPQEAALKFMAREIAQAATGMAPGITGIVGGRPRPFPRIRLFSTLIHKSLVSMQVDVAGETITVPAPMGEDTLPDLPEYKAPAPMPTETNVPLVALAYGRSGDKGNNANIGIMARKPEYYPYLYQALTEERVKAWLEHLLDDENSTVKRWQLPGIHGLNFLLTGALGGGGIASLRIDPQGKAFAQQLLEIPIPVSQAIAREVL